MASAHRDTQKQPEQVCHPRYVLITPARDEAAFIARTIEAVLAQTAPPQAWAICINDSTDSTAEIVQTYASNHPVIRTITCSFGGKRAFSAKSAAVSEGYSMLSPLSFGLVGVLDADISFGPCFFECYFARLVAVFSKRSRLGLARQEWQTPPE